MKRALKITSITLLVVLAVGVAGLLFYRYVIQKNIDKVDVVAMSLDKKDDDVLTKLCEINSIIKADDSSDARLDVMILTITRLNDSAIILGEYFAMDEVLHDINIRKVYDAMKDDVVLFNKMYDEFKIKNQDELYFPKHEGVNDMFNTMSDYIINYSKLILKLNKKLDSYSIDRKLDVKFAIIDLYANVCLNAYSNLIELNYATRLDLESYSNLNYMNSKVEFASGEVKNLLVSRYSNEARLFTTAYFNCDSEKLAKTVNSIVNSVNEATKLDSKENTAGYYLVQVLGR